MLTQTIYRPRLDYLIFEPIQTAYVIFMYYYKFVKVIYDKITYINTIFTNLNL
jgi:hypothetical protein